MSLRSKTFSGIIWSAIQQFSTQGIRFVVSIFLARTLLPEEFGLIGMIAIFMAVATELITSGLGTSLIRADAPDERDFSTVFFYNLVASVILYIMLFITAPLIADFFDQPQLISITRLYALTFIISSVSVIQISVLRKTMNFKGETRASVISTIFSAIVGIGMAKSGFGVMSLVWMSIVGAAVQSLILWFGSSWRPKLIFDRKKFRYHYKFGYRMAIAGVLNAVFNNIYTLVIGKLFSPAQLGFYTRADTLKQFPVSNIGTVLNKVTFPLFAEIKNDNQRLRSAYREIIQLVIYIIAPLLIFMGILAEPLFRFLFTEKWLPAVPYFQILCINGILYPLHSYNLNILLVKGRSDLVLRLETLKKIILAVILVSSVPFGIYGLLWGQVIYSVTCYFINSFYSGKMIEYPALNQLYDISGIIVLTFAVGVILYFFNEFVINSSFGDLLRILANLFVGFFLFYASSYFLKVEALQNIIKMYHSNIKKHMSQIKL
ncbi:lipopolysaccharide biosynthesis protein [Chryseobacterium suipulveris]|uniref:Lipopolysaccharide biosynthesis protein n=1 Tax=Chryseobacterium suipulveris TaxID=2929800 RepID=A0ABY4BQP9_9FLAO|nr:lipopolysaccharide biosynthesis protein [Chryseobacterium suipulveris]UOE41523.1 lipopolysaccharide biosynthesis protein [Chryseobacterium suipulveris]